jgi:tungstate transport system ATP-binding protein
MNAAREPVYRLQGVAKEYGSRRVLEVESLEIYPGEIFALVGPSGAGKSTLLRMLNFLEFPSRGSIFFHDTEFRLGQEMPLAQRRRVTTVFQRPMLLDRTVQENVAYGLHLRGEQDVQGAVQAALDEVGLSALARQRARTLSGGEAQRVALARALVLCPDVLLLDEPTANLDPANVGIIESIARRLNQTPCAHGCGVTVALVTHNVFQARRMAHRAAFLLDGKVIEVAEAAKFFDEPQDPRTAAFVKGEMIY